MVQIQPNGEPRFVFLDCGIIFRASSEAEHKALMEICLAFMKHDGITAGRLMIANSKGVTVGDSDAFCRGIQKMIQDTEKELFYEHFGEYLERICDLARTFHVKLDPNYFHVAMVLKVGEGIALALNRDIDMISTCIPIVLKAQALQKLGIKRFPVPGEEDKMSMDELYKDARDNAVPVH